MTFTTKNALRFFILSTAAALSTGVAQAQDQASESGEVVVTGRRPLAESEANALKIQKQSDSLVSVLSADAIGDLPDQNIAFAVGRLPGVGIERDQGQARYVNLRGAPVYWTTLSFDGLSVVSPEGRASRFDNIPSAIASQITVQKALVPSMPGDTVAGNVDIRTRRAFDYKGQKITGKLGAGYVKLGSGLEIDSSLVYSNIFLGGKLGVVAQASYYSREMATENWETDPYLTNTTDPTKHFAQETKNKHYRLTRENYSASTRLDYKFDDFNSVFVSTINTVFHDDELRDQFIFQLNQGTNAAGQSYTSAGYISGNNPVYGTAYGARISARITYRDNYDRMSTNTIGGENRLFDGLDMSWRVNYTWTDNIADNPAEVRFQNGSNFLTRPTVVYDFRDGDSNIVSLYRTTGVTGARTIGAQVVNVEDFDMPMSQLSYAEAKEVTKAWTGKVDFDYATKLFGQETKVEFGGLYTTREKENNEYNFSATPLSTTLRYSDLAKNGKYLGKQRLGYTFRYSDKDKVLSLVDTARAGSTLTFNTANYWKVTEDISAAYLMATTDLGWGNVVYGARVEQIENTGEAYVTFPAAGTNPASTRLVETKSQETLVYPSIHLNRNFTENLKGRIGLTTSASRPDYDDLRPNFVIDDLNRAISGGNPDAQPEKQTGFDAYLEYYQPNSFVSVGYFYKDIKDVLIRRAVTFGRTDLDTAGFDRSTYTLTTVGNGGDGYLNGVEVYYSGSFKPIVQSFGLPAWTEGFGAKVSATFTKSEVEIPAVGTSPARKIALLGSSDSVFNVQATYEKYGLSARLAYQYRTPWGQSVGDYQTIGGAVYPAGNGDIFWDADEELDLSIRYQINKNYEVYLDGVNLTNQGAKRYADQVSYPIEFEKFGQRFIVGVRFNY